MKPTFRQHIALTLLLLTVSFKTFGAGCDRWQDLDARLRLDILYKDNTRRDVPHTRMHVDGKPMNFIVDTGATVHVGWMRYETGAQDDAPNAISTDVSEVPSRQMTVDLSDRHGKSITGQTLYLPMRPSALDDTYSGLLSPQALAGPDVAIIDFAHGCLLIAEAKAMKEFLPADASTVALIPNPYGIIGTRLQIGDVSVPVLVDSGAANTRVIAGLLSGFPVTGSAPSSVDMFGVVGHTPSNVHRVEMHVLGKTYRDVSVGTQAALTTGGIDTLGLIGMDLLRDMALIYDGSARALFVIRHEAPSEAS